MNTLYETETPLADLDSIDVPAWFTGDPATNDVAEIIEGGCSSGAWMPAVRYRDAVQTMSEHGDDVLQYLQDYHGELPVPADCESWSGIAVHYLSAAVELWCACNEDAITEALEEYADD